VSSTACSQYEELEPEVSGCHSLAACLKAVHWQALVCWLGSVDDEPWPPCLAHPWQRAGRSVLGHYASRRPVHSVQCRCCQCRSASPEHWMNLEQSGEQGSVISVLPGLAAHACSRGGWQHV
jgi:hypothetical protein